MQKRRRRGFPSAVSPRRVTSHGEPLADIHAIHTYLHARVYQRPLMSVEHIAAVSINVYEFLFFFFSPFFASASREHTLVDFCHWANRGGFSPLFFALPRDPLDNRHAHTRRRKHRVRFSVHVFSRVIARRFSSSLQT